MGSEVNGSVTLAQRFERAIDEIAHDPHFAMVEIVTHSVRRHGTTSALSVTIDCEGGVDLHTCERVAGHINRALDEYDDRYTLEVESAGLNRPLTKPADYERFAGQNAKVVTSLLIGGQKTHRGVLRGVRGTNVILETGKGELPLPLATIDKANLEYDIRSDLKRGKKERKRNSNS